MSEVKPLATMPGKEELFSKLLFLINSPAQRLATVINAAGRDVAVVLGQAVEQGKVCAEAAPSGKPAAPHAARSFSGRGHPAAKQPVEEAQKKPSSGTAEALGAGAKQFAGGEHSRISRQLSYEPPVWATSGHLDG